ncbi:MAG: malto-oligosyltrehalose synthase [Corynebacterium sp.]|nr:malto-oligosyltrehalose synthase [Corynebacterium sp.]
MKEIPAIPVATYRLQLRGAAADPSGRAFGFAEAESIIDYIAELGVSHLFLSPILQATSGSAHGYDVTNPLEVNAELGGLAGFRSLARKAHEAGLGIVLDIVPNHLGVATPHENPWWWDVLTYGQDSEYEHYFDIDWGKDNGADGKLGLPVLGAAGDEKELDFAELNGETVLAYYDNYYPITPGSLAETPLATYENQHYRLLYWRSGVINYRRFFSVNELAGIRQELPDVFEASHRVIMQLISEGLVDGIRVDHPDGLADPFDYLHKLRHLIGDRWLVIEKILSATEPLDPRLDVDGTTGYDALREYDGVFVLRRSEDALSMLALREGGSTWDAQVVHATERLLKADVARFELKAEVLRLVRAIRRDNFSITGTNVTDDELIDAVIDLVADLPVYRADYRSLSRLTATAIADLSRRFPSRRNALDVIAAAMLVEGEAATRFAQVCGAVMAKGVEDTTFYRAHRLVALQEVGGDPGRFGVSAAEFHMLQKERADLWPRAMTTLSTHDTKRSEDVRARIIAVSIIPTEFVELTRTVNTLVPPPDGATGHFLFQNIVGIWPADGVITSQLQQRLHAYAEKALREAGLHTTWIEPNESFENSVRDWIDSLLQGPVTTKITNFVQRLEKLSIPISLSRKLLQLTGPGIPDIYQGTEILDDSLVDPDNRRFIDYTYRRQLLAQDKVGNCMDDSDAAKLHITRTALAVRRAFPQSFVAGDYQAVFAQGPQEGACIGFARGPQPGEVQVISFAIRNASFWDDPHQWAGTTLTLPTGTWEDALTGARFKGETDCGQLFTNYPCVLLIRQSDDA